MVKHASMSNCKDPQNRSKKGCACGGHNDHNRGRNKRKPARVTIRKMEDRQ